VLTLEEKDFMARGGERECFFHPSDSKKIIKILYKKNGTYAYGGSRNNIEYKYYKFLEKSKIPFLHISKCYEFVDTNLGKGLVFDKVYDYDGKISAPLTQIILKKRLDIKTETLVMNELKNFIFENNILFIDNALNNILCCEYEKSKFRLIIIDGLGGKREGFKFWFYLHSKMYTKYKIRKQWKDFIKKYTFFKKNLIKYKKGRDKNK